jgi:hypothetical protein
MKEGDMRTFILALGVLLLLACQRAETDSGSLEDVSAGAGLADTCLELLDERAYTDAVDICQRALAESPDSVVLRDALALAMEQVEGASDAATDALRSQAD